MPRFVYCARVNCACYVPIDQENKWITCETCGVTRYCSIECKNMHHENHQKDCDATTLAIVDQRIKKMRTITMSTEFIQQCDPFFQPLSPMQLSDTWLVLPMDDAYSNCNDVVPNMDLLFKSAYYTKRSALPIQLHAPQDDTCKIVYVHHLNNQPDSSCIYGQAVLRFNS